VAKRAYGESTLPYNPSERIFNVGRSLSRDGTNLEGREHTKGRAANRQTNKNNSPRAAVNWGRLARKKGYVGRLDTESAGEAMIIVS